MLYNIALLLLQCWFLIVSLALKSPVNNIISLCLHRILIWLMMWSYSISTTGANTPTILYMLTMLRTAHTPTIQYMLTMLRTAQNPTVLYILTLVRTAQTPTALLYIHTILNLLTTMRTAMIPPMRTIAWNTSVHTTAFTPPCDTTYKYY